MLPFLLAMVSGLCYPPREVSGPGLLSHFVSVDEETGSLTERSGAKGASSPSDSFLSALLS